MQIHMCFLLHRVGHLWVGGDRRYRMRHNPPLPWRLSIDIGADIDIGTNYMPKQTISGIKVDKYTAGRIGSDSLNFPISYINMNSEYLSLTCRDASIHSISFELLHYRHFWDFGEVLPGDQSKSIAVNSYATRLISSLQ